MKIANRLTLATVCVCLCFSYLLIVENSVISPLSSSNNKKDETNQRYIPAPVEQYVLENLDALGYLKKSPPGSNTCDFINDKDKYPFRLELKQYLEDVDNFSVLITSIDPVLNHSNWVREKQKAQQQNYHTATNICDRLEVTSDFMHDFFKSRQLSYSPKVGYLEPLLPTMRHPHICKSWGKYLMNMDYILHDFYHMCRHLKPTARVVFVDMGASIDFHSRGTSLSPNVYVQMLYSKFGFHFDHIYAYEINPKEATKVYELLPNSLLSSWHWINVGVDATPGGKMNPFTMLTAEFDKEDFIVVKLDIDTPSVEIPLVHQLRNDSSIAEIVDQFYFEHHVHQEELYRAWGRGGSVQGSVGDSLVLMYELRKSGIGAHYWP